MWAWRKRYRWREHHWEHLPPPVVWAQSLLVLQFPSRKPWLDLTPIDYSFYSLGCVPYGFSTLEEERMRSSGGGGRRQSLFRLRHSAGRNAEAAGPEGSKHHRAQPGPSGQDSLLGEAGPGFESLINILPMENEGTKIILFLVNLYTKNQLFHNSAVKHFLGWYCMLQQTNPTSAEKTWLPWRGGSNLHSSFSSIIHCNMSTDLTLLKQHF